MNALRLFAFGLLVALFVGFGLFMVEARQYREDDSVSADGIVVLTGGHDRVVSAVALLKAERGERLLISGAHPESPQADIAAAAGAPESLFECCVDTGVSAQNTIGNAQETALWVENHDYERVIVVTNDYHMPRALLELSRAMPDTELVAYGVVSELPHESAISARRWVQEYLKYVAVYTRERLKA